MLRAIVGILQIILRVNPYVFFYLTLTNRKKKLNEIITRILLNMESSCVEMLCTDICFNSYVNTIIIKNVNWIMIRFVYSVYKYSLFALLLKHLHCLSVPSKQHSYSLATIALKYTRILFRLDSKHFLFKTILHPTFINLTFSHIALLSKHPYFELVKSNNYESSFKFLFWIQLSR